MDGLNTEGKTVEELMEKVTHLLNVRVAALEELGKNEEAEQLSERQVIFTKE
jgi:predicted RNase H-like HicB family nuclease